ncbi:L-arabinose transport system permease protein AraQ [subsurface metagenome]
MKKLKAFLPYLIMYGLAFLWFVPVLWMADTAFKPDPEIFSRPPRWIPSHFSLEQMRKLFADWPFLRWLLRSVTVASVTAAGSLVLSTLAAFSFARLRWKGRDTLFLILLGFMLLPFEVNVIPLFFTMAKLKLLNTIPGVTLPLIALPIGVFLLRQFFINIPGELEDAARIDGCSTMGVLLRVIVPVSRPVLGAYSVYIFNLAWNEFFWAMICLQKSDMLTLPVGLRYIQGALDIDFGIFMAAATLAALPSLFVFLVLRKQVIRGFTLAGASLKG